MINEFVGRALTCTASELLPQPSHPLFNVPLPTGFGGQQSCGFTSGEKFVLAQYDVDCVNDSAWAQLGYACIFMCGFLFFAIRAISNIDHSSLAALLPPLFRDIGLRKKATKGEARADTEVVAVDGGEGSGAPVQKRLFLTFQDLCYSVMAPGPVHADGSGGEMQEKKILHSIFGVAAPGQLIALMCVLSLVLSLPQCVIFNAFFTRIALSR